MVDKNDWRSFGDLFEDYISDNNTGVCIKTGIKQVDDIMRIEESSLTVIAGAKEAGKTTLAMQMALHMAKQNLKVAFFTLKETKMQAVEIALANEIGVSVGDVENKIQSGWKLEPPVGDYEVLRARRPGYPRPLLVHDRTSGGCGYSIDERDSKVYRGWLKNRRKRGLPDQATIEEMTSYWKYGTEVD